METSENDVFGGTMKDIIGEVAGDKGVKLNPVNVGEQTLADTRRLYHRMGERFLNARVYNVTQRFLPSGSSALDVSMVVTGDYRPPPYLDLDVIAEDSINRAGERVVSTLKERGSRAGSQFFDRVSGVEAVARAAVTPRPTRTPTAKPTPGPSKSVFICCYPNIFARLGQASIFFARSERPRLCSFTAGPPTAKPSMEPSSEPSGKYSHLASLLL